MRQDGLRTSFRTGQSSGFPFRHLPLPVPDVTRHCRTGRRRTSGGSGSGNCRRNVSAVIYFLFFLRVIVAL
jgi:hypothetical protein